LYLFLPASLALRFNFIPVKLLVSFYSFNIIIAIYSFNISQSRFYNLRIKNQDLKEQINIIAAQRLEQLKTHEALLERIKRYHKLKDIIEDINQGLRLESVADKLSEIGFSLIAKGKGVSILYRLDQEVQKLNLYKTKKEDQKLIIKAKEGDIFDLWVLRHTSPLLIEDIKTDFRFDLDKLKALDKRSVVSLISAPLLSAHRLLGILRLDYNEPRFFSQDDLRFLVTICDMGAVALENGELFERTQELAIHDELTALYTKGYFLERLGEEYRRSVRQNRTLALLMLDIDYFKNYNDKFGHTAGDIVLRALSQGITDYLKDLSPIISRFGGEEFCVILAGLSRDKIMAIAEGLRKKIEELKIVLRRYETSVTVSIGVAIFPLDYKDEEELIIKSDRAMYEAKQKGRNQVCGIT